jgi:two-component system, chemotaxis family, sensor kinase CheA
MSMEFNDDALIAEFVMESRDHLSSIEPDLLELEQDAGGTAINPDLINRIFRAIHSIKGASGFFGFEHLKHLSHVMENLLMLVRDGQMVVSAQLVEALLKGVDKLNLLLADISASDTVPIDEELADLDAVLNPSAADTVTEKASSEVVAAGIPENQPAPVAPTVAAKPLGGGTRFVLTVDPAALNKSWDEFLAHLCTFGEVVATEQQADGQQQVLISTVLEYDLVVLATSLTESQVKQADTLDVLATPVAQAAPTAPAAEPVQFAKPLGGGTRYVLTVDPAALSKPWDEFLAHLRTFGEVLSSEQQPNGHQQVLIATVLEYDLVVLATTLSENQVKLADDASAVVSSPATAEPKAAAVEVIPPAAAPVAAKPAAPAAAAKAPEKKAPAPAAAAKPAASSEANDTIRVRIDLLNKLMELAGEMVLSRNQLLRTLSEESARKSDAGKQSDARRSRNLDTIVQNIDLITTDLQEHIMQTRMQPIGSVFGKFPRIVRDMAKQLGKEINLVTQGEDVELDKSIIESLSDPLTHLIRNCCDHGLEPPDERETTGKGKIGTIRLRAFHQDGQINISIIDDGRGINTDRLVSKAISKNLITQDQIDQMQPQELVNLIFLPGLSTAETVSEISGRGVGMDVVKTNINRLGGQIQIETDLGQGTELLLRLPLTLAIIPSLIVGVADQRFAVPQVNLVELLYIHSKDIPSRVEKVGSATVLRLRKQLLPLLKLSEILEIESPKSSGSNGYNVMVLRTGNQQFGVIVDELFDTEEIVVKSLSSFLKSCRCFSGATIMGDGHVAMILDPNGIVAHSGLSFEALESEQRKLGAIATLQAGMKSENMLLFNNAASEVFAIPLKDVLRLEKFQVSEITNIGHREFINYDGKGLPIVRLESYLPVAPIDYESIATEAYLILPKQGGGKVGIVVSKVLDVMETSCEWKPSTDDIPGIAGWAVLQDHITVRLDLPTFLQSVLHISNEVAA